VVARQTISPDFMIAPPIGCCLAEQRFTGRQQKQRPTAPRVEIDQQAEQSSEGRPRRVRDRESEPTLGLCTMKKPHDDLR